MRRALLCLFLWSATANAAPPAASPESMQAAKARFRQGKAFHDLGAYDQAIAEFEAAYALVPLPELVFNIARAQQKKNEIDKALETYRRYLELDPEGRVADEARRQVALLVVAQSQAKPVPKVETPLPEPRIVFVTKPAPPQKSHRTAIAVGVTIGVVAVAGIAIGLGLGLSQPTKGAFDSAVMFPPVKGM